MLRLCLTQLLKSGQSPEDGTNWATFQTACGSRIVFWGCPELGFVNINMLKHQTLPIVIDVEEEPEDCLASPTVKQRYKCDFSVSEETYITVHPVAANI